MKPVVLYLRYKDRGPWRIKKLSRILKKIYGHVPRIVVVDNQAENKSYGHVDENISIVGGDNSDWEFSGWQKALLILEKQIRSEYDSILFVNDSFLNYGGCFLEECTYAKIENGHKSGALTGVVDKSLLDLKIAGYDVSSWVRSNAFIMPVDLAYHLYPFNFINEKNLNDYLDATYQGRYFKDEADLSKDLKDHIAQWLEKQWHKRFPASSNWNLYRQKTKAMLNEKMLTSRARLINSPICSCSPLDGTLLGIFKRLLLGSIPKKTQS